MKPVSMWVILGMSLSLVTGAVAQPPAKNYFFGDFGDLDVMGLKQNAPTTPGSTPTAAIVIPSGNPLNPTLDGSSTNFLPTIYPFTAIRPQPAPPERLPTDVVPQDPLAPATNLMIIREDDFFLGSNH